jgi:transposase
VDLYDVFCAILYVLKSGCQWRMIPKDFPKWRTCYAYWQIWTSSKEDGLSILEQALKKTGRFGSATQGQTGDTNAMHS